MYWDIGLAPKFSNALEDIKLSVVYPNLTHLTLRLYTTNLSVLKAFYSQLPLNDSIRIGEVLKLRSLKELRFYAWNRHSMIRFEKPRDSIEAAYDMKLWLEGQFAARDEHKVNGSSVNVMMYTLAAYRGEWQKIVSDGKKAFECVDSSSLSLGVGFLGM